MPYGPHSARSTRESPPRPPSLGGLLTINRAGENEADAVKSITPRASIYMTHGSVAGPDSPYGELQPWVAHRDGRSDERIFRTRSPAMADRDSLSGRATATDAGRTEAAAHSRPESGAARLLLLAEDAGNHLRRLLPVQGPGGLRECNRRRSAD